MSLQGSIYSETTLSDFSTALLRASNKDQNLQFTEDRSVNISPNRNLSSLLSQIQDDGPAYAGNGSVKRDKFFNRKKTNNSASTSQQLTGLNSNVALSVPSNGLQQDRRANTAIVKTKSNASTWLLFLLMLCVAVSSAFTLLKLDLRTSELEESLNLYDASLQDSTVSQTQSENLSFSITNTSDTLQSIQQELQLIKTDYEALDEKYTKSIENRVSPQVNESVSDTVGELKYEILALKSELQTVKNKLVITGEDENLIDTAVVSSGLIVNLASLTNKNKVEEIVEQLQQAGLSPLIQQAVVKGIHVYRLSVSGFLNRDEAESFIRKAGEEYGMKDGWIRKG